MTVADVSAMIDWLMDDLANINLLSKLPERLTFWQINAWRAAFSKDSDKVTGIFVGQVLKTNPYSEPARDTQDISKLYKSIPGYFKIIDFNRIVILNRRSLFR